VRVKLATSLDGRTALANGESKWITGAAARADVQRWRARSSAILTGSGTVLADDPRLTVRLGESCSTDGQDAGGARAPVPHPDPLRQAQGRALPGGERERCVAPLRVVLDRGLRTPAGSHVLDGSVPTLVLHGAQAVAADERFVHVEHAVVAEQGGMLDLPEVLAVLAERGCNELHVEAGPTLCGALFAQGLADELLLYVAPVLLGDAARPLLRLPALDDMAGRWRLRVVEQRSVGPDWRLRLRPLP
jgi:diaminohydroxyphosphoribosylaminopyrimidine deaminase/5-amino-6-(5-phosphoribosylamino)uracil reductase